MVGFLRSGWDVVVAVVGGDPEAGYIEGVYVVGKRKHKHNVRVRDHGHSAELVRAVLDDMDQPPSDREPVKVPLQWYRSGETPTYYADTSDLELLDPSTTEPGA